MTYSTTSATATTVLGLLVMMAAPDCSDAQTAVPVTVAEDDTTYTLANGIVAAKVSKASGDLVSLAYKGVETLEGKSGHPFGYWSHDARARQQLRAVTIDPKANGGERAEVSVKGISDGQPIGSGPGGGFVADVEIRYALGRGDAGVYTYSIFDHRPEYPASTLGEARFCAKLNADVFDWMSVDAKRNKLYPKDSRENKYNYTAVQFDNPAFGWSSTTKNIGFWLVNPTVEYGCISVGAVGQWE